MVIKRVSSGGHVSGCARNVRVFDYLLLSSGLIRWVVIQWRRKKLRRRRRRIPLYRLVFKSSNFERKSASSVPGVGTPRDGSVVKKSEGTKVEEQNKSSFLVEFAAAPLPNRCLPNLGLSYFCVRSPPPSGFNLIKIRPRCTEYTTAVQHLI